jgi:uncharacterized SAM-binding protein YcdF (DUF218 family)
VRACRWLGAATLVAMAVLGFTPLADVTLPAPPPELRPADAIVVLGSYMGQDGTLSAASLQRAVHGIQLYRRGLAPLLVMTGAREGPMVEAEVRAQLARDFGVPAAAVLTEPGGRTTRDEAGRVRALLNPRAARHVLLVTSGEHMERARIQFEREGFVVSPAPVGLVRPKSLRPEDRLAQARRWAQELAARLYYRAVSALG